MRERSRVVEDRTKWVTPWVDQGFHTFIRWRLDPIKGLRMDEKEVRYKIPDTTTLSFHFLHSEDLERYMERLWSVLLPYVPNFDVTERSDYGVGLVLDSLYKSPVNPEWFRGGTTPGGRIPPHHVGPYLILRWRPFRPNSFCTSIPLRYQKVDYKVYLNLKFSWVKEGILFLSIYLGRLICCFGRDWGGLRRILGRCMSFPSDRSTLLECYSGTLSVWDVVPYSFRTTDTRLQSTRHHH